jgi:hypothetical protein
VVIWSLGPQVCHTLNLVLSANQYLNSAVTPVRPKQRYEKSCEPKSLIQESFQSHQS